MTLDAHSSGLKWEIKINKQKISQETLSFYKTQGVVKAILQKTVSLQTVATLESPWRALFLIQRKESGLDSFLIL